MRRAITLTAVAALAVATATAALAGGWAVTTVDSTPEEFEANTTYTIEYTVRAHGKTPVDAGPSQVTFHNTKNLKATKGDDPLSFEAVYVGDGRYRVEVTLPSEGTWAWEVTHGYGPQELGVVEVAAGGSTASGFEATDALKVILPLATLLAAGYTLRDWSRRRAGKPTAETG